MRNTTNSQATSIPRSPLVCLDHITHIDNLESILTRGLKSHNNAYQQTDISNPSVNSRRARCEPINGKPIHSYVPLYFNAKNAMLYKVQKAHNENIIILGYDTSVLTNALITDGNAACNKTRFFSDYNSLNQLDWGNVFADTWIENEETKRKMMAEILVPRTIKPHKLRYIFCQTKRMKSYIEMSFDVSGVQVIVNKNTFF